MGHNFFTKIFENHQFTKTEASIDFHKKKGAINPICPGLFEHILRPGLGKIRLLILFVNELIVYSIFALYRDTKTIHSIMMIWLVIFIISNYNLASGPPKDPGGVKKHIFKIKGH